MPASGLSSVATSSDGATLPEIAASPGPGASGMPVTEPLAPAGVGNASAVDPSGLRAPGPPLSPHAASSRTHATSAQAMGAWRLGRTKRMRDFLRGSLIEVEGDDAIADRRLTDATAGHASPH